MIFQEPMTSLNPLMTIGRQIVETDAGNISTSRRSKRRSGRSNCWPASASPIRSADLGQYPHEFSGGMRQRAMIAIALACDPKIIIADEPTTALDVTIQAQILDLLRGLVDRLGLGLVLITHNLGLVARYADRVNVMYAGRIVESGTTQQVLRQPRQPLHRRPDRRRCRISTGRDSRQPAYGSPASRPALRSCRRAALSGRAVWLRRPPARRMRRRQDGRRPLLRMRQPGSQRRRRRSAALIVSPAATRTIAAPVLSVRGLTKEFDARQRHVSRQYAALHGIDFDVSPAGEHARASWANPAAARRRSRERCCRLEQATSGSATSGGRDILALSEAPKSMRQFARTSRWSIQDPYGVAQSAPTASAAPLERAAFGPRHLPQHGGRPTACRRTA